jgi:hypothetical protein
MKKIIGISLLAVGLAACSPSNPQLIQTQLKVVKPAAAMYQCPVVTQFPDPKTLTDIQTARLILTLYQNNITCKNSIDAIKRFLDDAEKRIESGLY